eukprot:3199732-Pyramimonas_sp.AAC.1
MADQSSTRDKSALGSTPCNAVRLYGFMRNLTSSEHRRLPRTGPSKAPGIYPPPARDCFPLRVYTLLPPAIGTRSGYIPSSRSRLVPGPGIYPPPARDWFPLRVYALKLPNRWRRDMFNKQHFDRHLRLAALS